MKIKNLVHDLAALSISGVMVFNAPYLNAFCYEKAIDPAVFSKQEERYSCTAASVAMMLRNYERLNDFPNWRGITEDIIKMNCSDWENVGLSWFMKIDNVYIRQKYIHKYPNEKKGYFINMLKEHPEGFVVYDESVPHAVFLTDYTDGIFYCSDPAGNVPFGRIPINESLVRIENIDAVWYIDSPGVNYGNTADDEITIPVTTTTTKPVLSETTTTTTCTTTETAYVVSSAETTATTSVIPDPVVTDITSYKIYYVSSLIGANWRSEPSYSTDTIEDIADTDELIYVEEILENGFMYGTRVRDNTKGYIHASTVSSLPKDTYQYGCSPTHRVISDIGANVRDFNNEKIACLDTYTEVCCLYTVGDYAFCEMVTCADEYLSGLIYLPLLEPLY